MKSATSVIALVAAIAPFALAVPFNYERDYVVTDTAVVTEYKQETAWVTEGAYPTASASADYHSQHWSQHRSHSHGSSSSSAPAETSAESSAPASSAPAYTAPASSTPSAFSASSLSTSFVPVPTTTEAATTEAPPPPPAPTTSSASPSETPSSASSAPVSSATGGAWVNQTVPQIDGDAAYTDENMKAIMIPAHNNARHQYQAPPVTWNDTSVQALKDFFANESLNPCSGDHYGTGIGQNIADGYTPEGSVGSWMSEADPTDVLKSGGHFTQVVWVASITIGCAAIHCPAYGWHTYCNYYPEGNFDVAGENSYPNNVKPHI